MIYKNDISLIQLFEALSSLSKKISEALQQNADASQLDALADEHRQLMAGFNKVPVQTLQTAIEPSLLKTVYHQVQAVQKEMLNHHHLMKEKILVFNKKRKQIKAYTM